MLLVINSALAATLKLTCPHCHYVQLRARKPKGTRYACRKCHKRFELQSAKSTAIKTAKKTAAKPTKRTP
jgi:transposase-like protein